MGGLKPWTISPLSATPFLSKTRYFYFMGKAENSMTELFYYMYLYNIQSFIPNSDDSGYDHPNNSSTHEKLKDLINNLKSYWRLKDVIEV